ncbi:hypothetical protein M0G74_08270 [Microbulbifer sp. CAU 1566]|uniref:hypothetical protein n=1 Tax=Microbulbifer sp. CAU 1566 TaxID=2933269 RepID=UPI002006167D|nr:hypothetical protein [Microbulbifer sp. CAU 1566]MCK7597263.1 hypothetical protein [Microbulbifer sp. CAU 1566]
MARVFGIFKIIALSTLMIAGICILGVEAGRLIDAPTSAFPNILLLVGIFCSVFGSTVWLVMEVRQIKRHC